MRTMNTTFHQHLDSPVPRVAIPSVPREEFARLVEAITGPLSADEVEFRNRAARHNWCVGPCADEILLRRSKKGTP